MSLEKLRAWWSHRQALDGRLAGASGSAVLEQTGWARSVGGVGPYLTLFARSGIRRAEADAAVSGLEIHELPTARGCTYVLPACDFALGLTAGEPFREAEVKTARKLGVTDEELGRLCDAVLGALESGTLSPDEIRDATGSASRSLGEEGKKKGLTTTLPLALSRLQASGDIRRVPMEGRLDQQRYRYMLWRPNPRHGFPMRLEEIQVELARRFFTWIGPATLAEFQTFAGLGVGASKKAVEPLVLEPVDGDLLILPEQRDTFEAFTAPTEPQYVLASSLDGISLLRSDLTWLLAPEDLGRQVFADKGMALLSGLTDMPSHPILDRGRLVGLWEYDTFAGEIAWLSFVPKNSELTAAVAGMERYVQEDLGDARSFSLDSPKSRTPKIAALRAAV